MNVKRKKPEQAHREEPVSIILNGIVNSKSVDAAKIVAELNRGHSVLISKGTSHKHQQKAHKGVVRKEYAKGRGLTLGTVATVLSGGVGLGLLSLAAAPASALFAAATSIVGAGLTAVLSSKIDKTDI
jgi:hypothetical protein